MPVLKSAARSPLLLQVLGSDAPGSGNMDVDIIGQVMEEAMEHGQETRKWAYIDKIFKRLYAEYIKE